MCVSISEMRNKWNYVFPLNSVIGSIFKTKAPVINIKSFVCKMIIIKNKASGLYDMPCLNRFTVHTSIQYYWFERGIFKVHMRYK